MRLKISTSGLYYLKSKDLYARGLADGETEEQKKQKATGLNLKSPRELQEFLENPMLVRHSCLHLTTDNRIF